MMARKRKRKLSLLEVDVREVLAEWYAKRLGAQFMWEVIHQPAIERAFIGAEFLSERP